MIRSEGGAPGENAESHWVNLVAPLAQPQKASQSEPAEASVVLPKLFSNRAAGVAIAALGTFVYALLFASVSALLFATTVSAKPWFQALANFVVTPAFWLPVIFFAIVLILFVLIVNRTGWWVYVLGSFWVGFIVYIAAIFGSLMSVQAWAFTFAQAADFLRSLRMDPVAIAAGLVAREVFVWTGAWIAARGRKATLRNRALREEYDHQRAKAARI